MQHPGCGSKQRPQGSGRRKGRHRLLWRGVADLLRGLLCRVPRAPRLLPRLLISRATGCARFGNPRLDVVQDGIAPAHDAEVIAPERGKLLLESRQIELKLDELELKGRELRPLACQLGFLGTLRLDDSWPCKHVPSASHAAVTSTRPAGEPARARRCARSAGRRTRNRRLPPARAPRSRYRSPESGALSLAKLLQVPLQAGAIPEAVEQLADDDGREENLLRTAHDLRDSAVAPLQMRVGAGVQQDLHRHMASSIRANSSMARSISSASSGVQVPIR